MRSELFEQDRQQDGRDFNIGLSPAVARRIEVYAASDDIWSLLPPHEELIQGCRVFLTTCLQVGKLSLMLTLGIVAGLQIDFISGFIPKALFLEQMETDQDSVNVFLLLSMLGISARFTPELCDRFKGSKNASEFFLDIAHIMIADEMWKTNLENAQAFFLLGMADWGRGDRERSAINMGIAVRMAAVLRLHREETYQLPSNASSDQLVDAERARRTFWVIQNHDNLYTQQHLPLSFAKSDITTLLPCDESDFAFGRRPRQRAALAGTKPALKDPALTSLPDRSLFSTLIQAHDLWGAIARDTSRDDHTLDSEPWLANSHYTCTAKALSSWEANIPREHRWSAWNLRGFKAEHVDLAYLSIITITRLNNIVLRRAYLDRIVRAMINGNDQSDTTPPGFWEQVSFELFSNAWSLYDAVDVWFTLRSTEDGFPAMLAFCIYISASLASHLHKWPQLCPRLAPSAEKILNRSLDVLSTFEDKWSTASQWSSVLREVAGHMPSQTSRPLEEVRSQEALLNTPAPVGHSPDASRASFAAAGSSHISSPTLVASESANSYQGHDSHTSQGFQPSTFENDDRDSMPKAMNTSLDNFSRANHLHLLSDAAVYDSLVDNALQSLPPLPFPTRAQRIPEEQQDHRQIGHSLQTDLSFLQDQLDVDFADVIQGYVHLGWTGWQ